MLLQTPSGWFPGPQSFISDISDIKKHRRDIQRSRLAIYHPKRYRPKSSVMSFRSTSTQSNFVKRIRESMHRRRPHLWCEHYRDRCRRGCSCLGLPCQGCSPPFRLEFGGHRQLKERFTALQHHREGVRPLTCLLFLQPCQQGLHFLCTGSVVNEASC